MVRSRVGLAQGALQEGGGWWLGLLPSVRRVEPGSRERGEACREGGDMEEGVIKRGPKGGGEFRRMAASGMAARTGPVGCDVEGD